MLLRAILLGIPGVLFLSLANRLIHAGLTGGPFISIVLGIINLCIGVMFTIGALTVGARALKDL